MRDRDSDDTPNHALQRNSAIALRLQSGVLVGRVAELRSLGD
jgi:hypothetical protein